MVKRIFNCCFILHVSFRNRNLLTFIWTLLTTTFMLIFAAFACSWYSCFTTDLFVCFEFVKLRPELWDCKYPFLQLSKLILCSSYYTICPSHFIEYAHLCMSVWQNAQHQVGATQYFILLHCKSRHLENNINIS